MSISVGVVALVFVLWNGTHSPGMPRNYHRDIAIPGINIMPLIYSVNSEVPDAARVLTYGMTTYKGYIGNAPQVKMPNTIAGCKRYLHDNIDYHAEEASKAGARS